MATRSSRTLLMDQAHATFSELLKRELPKLYAFAYQMCSSRADAHKALSEFVLDIREHPGPQLIGQAPEAGRALLGAFARYLDVALNRGSSYTFDSLDEILRSDITRPIDVNTMQMGGDPTRVHLMLWELKRTCLTAVLSCLPPAVRLSFVLTDLLGYSPNEGAELLQIKESAYRVRLTRARKRIEDYLTPRCQHVDPQNPCSCTGRLMIAIDSGFVRPNEMRNNDDIPHEPHDASSPIRDVGALYRSLPEVQLIPKELEKLLSSEPESSSIDLSRGE